MKHQDSELVGSAKSPHEQSPSIPHRHMGLTTIEAQQAQSRNYLKPQWHFIFSRTIYTRTRPTPFTPTHEDNNPTLFLFPHSNKPLSLSLRKCRHRRRPGIAAKSGELCGSGKCSSGGERRHEWRHPMYPLDTWRFAWDPTRGGSWSAPVTWTTRSSRSFWCRRRRSTGSVTMDHSLSPATSPFSKSFFGSWPDPNHPDSPRWKIHSAVATWMSEVVAVVVELVIVLSL